MKRTQQEKYDLFYGLRVPKHLQAQWVRVEDEARDNAAQTEGVNGLLMGYVTWEPAFVDAFIGTIETIVNVSDGYTQKFRDWLETNCGIVG